MADKSKLAMAGLCTVLSSVTAYLGLQLANLSKPSSQKETGLENRVSREDNKPRIARPITKNNNHGLLIETNSGEHYLMIWKPDGIYIELEEYKNGLREKAALNKEQARTYEEHRKVLGELKETEHNQSRN